ncbi:unnamed protein product [Closterium sp. NIES-64]|nr:unnamed protein product [Closterium sp. NIES-64]CAI6012027.1 unnamed protein product [Closterium sp. NIES-65]
MPGIFNIWPAHGPATASSNFRTAPAASSAASAAGNFFSKQEYLSFAVDHHVAAKPADLVLTAELSAIAGAIPAPVLPHQTPASPAVKSLLFNQPSISPHNPPRLPLAGIGALQQILRTPAAGASSGERSRGCASGTLLAAQIIAVSGPAAENSAAAKAGESSAATAAVTAANSGSTRGLHLIHGAWPMGSHGKTAASHGAKSGGSYDSNSSGSAHDPSSVCLAEMVSDFMETGSAESHTLDHRLLDAIHGSEGGYNADAMYARMAEQDAQAPRMGESGGWCGMGDVSSLIESLSACTSADECQLFADVIAALKTAKKEASSSNAACSSGNGSNGATSSSSNGNLRRAVMCQLRSKGYDAAVCKARWEHSKGLPGGTYEYIDVILPCHGNNSTTSSSSSMVNNTNTSASATTTATAANPSPFSPSDRIIVDIEFRAQFQIARPTFAFDAVVHSAPIIFVGRLNRLLKITEVLADATRQSLREQGLHLPPWRRAEYLRTKWAGPYRRTTNQIPRSGSSTQLAGGSGTSQVAPVVAAGGGGDSAGLFELPASRQQSVFGRRGQEVHQQSQPPRQQPHQQPHQLAASRPVFLPLNAARPAPAMFPAPPATTIPCAVPGNPFVATEKRSAVTAYGKKPSAVTGFGREAVEGGALGAVVTAEHVSQGHGMVMRSGVSHVSQIGLEMRRLAEERTYRQHGYC